MQYIRVLIILLDYPPFLTSFLLILSWAIWALLNWLRRARPALSTMLVFSASLLIVFFKFERQVAACLELCPMDVSFGFIAEIGFWFAVLYLTTKLVFIKAQR